MSFPDIMPQKAYLWILRVGIGLSFLSVFLVYTEFLFPYITSKQIYFNVIVEILVVFWLAFIIKYPDWNPFRKEKYIAKVSQEKLDKDKEIKRKKKEKKKEKDNKNNKEKFKPATQNKRFLNLILDAIFLYIFAFIFSSFFYFINSYWIVESGQLYISIFLYFIFYLFFESIWHKTPSKFLTKTKVVMNDGAKPDFKHILGRTLSRFIPFEAFTFLGSKHPVGWHDKFSKTLVVPDHYDSEKIKAIKSSEENVETESFNEKENNRDNVVSVEKTRKKTGISLITLGLIAYFVAMLITSITSVDFNLSFWGDIERMLGFFHVAHFLFLYLIIITVLRDWEDWRWLLLFFAVITTAVGITGIFGKEAYGTVGNKAYMAGFMLFGIFISVFLLLKDKSYLRWVNPFLILIMLWAFKGAGIAGAYAGLGAAVVVFLFFYGLVAPNKIIKAVCLGSFLVIVAGSLFALTHKDAPVIRDIKPIQDFSLEENTLQTRFIAWQAAWKDFKHHPVLGSGYGNFAITFDKYFDADFYNYTRSGTYFDRAHNNLIGIASTMGLLGLLTYLSIFLAVLYYLWRLYKSERIKNVEVVALLSLLAAYFVQNLAVFDSLATYIGLMVFLGFIHFLFNTERDEGNKKALYVKDKKFTNNEIYSLAGVGLVMLFILYQFNFLPAQMLYETIQGQKALSQRNPEKAVELYQEALDKGAGVLDRDSRDSFIRSIMSKPASLSRLNLEKRNEILDQAIEWAEANVAYNPEDSLAQLRLAQISNFAARFNYENQEKFQKYSDKALEAVNKSLESSPERVPTYYTKAEILLTQNKPQEAIKVLNKAKELNPNYEDTYCQLAEIYLISQDKEKGFENMDKCLDMGAVSKLKFDSVIKNAINHYLESGENEKVLKLYQRLSQVSGRDPKVWVRLAQLYAQMGKIEKAKQAANRAAELNPELKSDVEGFINSLGETKTIEMTPVN